MSLSTGERSFLKWVGGKTRYASTLAQLRPNYTGIYREPFLGSGALFFEIRPAAAALSDTNEELVVCFQQVAANPEAVMSALDSLPNTPEFFASVRRQNPEHLSDLERGARVIYLNKTSFRGLWRVNKKNQFNTPYGAYNRPYYNRDTLLKASSALSGAIIESSDFETALDGAEAGDWVYLDPPYVPLGGWADFKRYTAGQFGPVDQERLSAAMQRASARGVLVTMTNSDTPFCREVFGAHFDTFHLITRRDINLQAKGRASADLIFINYVPPSCAAIKIEY